MLTDPHAPMAALAAAWRLPDPARDLPGFLAHLVLAAYLGEGSMAPLRELIRPAGAVADASCRVGMLSNPFDARNPAPFVINACHRGPADRVLDTIDAALRPVAAEGITPDALLRIRSHLTVNFLQEADNLLGQAAMTALLEQLHGRAALFAELPELISRVTSDQVRQAASGLRPGRRAVLEIRPGAQPAGPRTKETSR